MYLSSCRRGFLVKRQVLQISFGLASVFKGYLYLSNLQKISLLDVINKSDVIRDRSRTLQNILDRVLLSILMRISKKYETTIYVKF